MFFPPQKKTDHKISFKIKRKLLHQKFFNGLAKKKEHSLHCVQKFVSATICNRICRPLHFMDLVDQMDQMDKNMRPESKGVHFVHFVHMGPL